MTCRHVIRGYGRFVPMGPFWGICGSVALSRVRGMQALRAARRGAVSDSSSTHAAALLAPPARLAHPIRPSRARGRSSTQPYLPAVPPRRLSSVSTQTHTPPKVTRRIEGSLRQTCSEDPHSPTPAQPPWTPGRPRRPRLSRSPRTSRSCPHASRERRTPRARPSARAPPDKQIMLGTLASSHPQRHAPRPQPRQP